MIKNKKFDNREEVCKWLNKNKVKVLSITSDGNSYFEQILYYEVK